MKGISEILGIILVLIITIALVGFAYSYISGVFTSRTSTQVSVAFTQNNLVTIQNQGANPIDTLTVTVDGQAATFLVDTNDPSQIGYWKENEGTGTTISGSPIGTLFSGTTSCFNGTCPTWVAGKYSYGISFDGVDDYVNISGVNPTPDITVAAWVLSSSPTGYSGKWQFVSRNNAFMLGTPAAGGNNVCFIVYTTSWNDLTNCYTISNPNSWHYFVGTFDSSASQLKLYVDGALVSTKTVTGSINLATGSIHMSHNVSSAIGTDHFDGIIDELRIYGRSFSDNEVAGLYQIGGLIPAGAVADVEIYDVLSTGSHTVKICAPSACTTAYMTVTQPTTTVTSTTSTTTTTLPPDFSISANPTSSSISQGSSTTYALNISSINGYSGTVSLAQTGCPPSSTCSYNLGSVLVQSGSSNVSVLNVSTSASTPVNTYTINNTATSGSVSHYVLVNTTVTSPPPVPDFSIASIPSSSAVAQGSSTTYTINITSLNSFTGTVSLSATSCPPLSTCIFNRNSVLIPTGGSNTSILNVSTSSSTATGSYNINTTGTSGSLGHFVLSSLTVNPGPDFSMTVTPLSSSVTQGNSTTYTINITALNGFTGSVTLANTGCPPSSTCSYNRNPVQIFAGSNTSILTVSTGGTTPTGIYSINNTGTSGSLSHYANLSLTVNPSAPSVGWWNTNWANRKNITLNNVANPSTLVNYTLNITLSFATGMKSDFSDVRFVNYNNIPLDYWTERVTPSASATFWVKFLSIPASSSLNISVYYNNSAATSLSNGANTFLTFDDMTNPSSWFTNDSLNFNISNGLLNFRGIRQITPQMMNRTISVSGNFEIISKVNLQIRNGWQYVPFWLQTAPTKPREFNWLISSYGIRFKALGVAPSWTVGIFYANATDSLVTLSEYTPTLNTNSTIKLRRSSTTLTAEIYNDTGSSLSSGSYLGASTTNYSFLVLGNEVADINDPTQYVQGKIDWFALRGYSPPEPLVSFGTVENKP